MSVWQLSADLKVNNTWVNLQVHSVLSAGAMKNIEIVFKSLIVCYFAAVIFNRKHISFSYCLASVLIISEIYDDNLQN